MPTPIFKRILLKLSGEVLAAERGFGIDPAHIHGIAAVHALGVEIAIGGGQLLSRRFARFEGGDAGETFAITNPKN